MNRLIRQQDTSKFTPDDWLRYTVPLVTYALREPSQGMNVQRIYQKIILMGVLVGLGKTPQEAINQVQEWQNTGVAKLLQGGILQEAQEPVEELELGNNCRWSRNQRRNRNRRNY